MTKHHHSSLVHCSLVHCSLFIAFVCLTLLITYPLPVQLATHLAGDDYDVWARPWATWWTKKAIREDRSLYHTDMLFYPLGISLVYHSFSHVNTLVALLLEPLTGHIAAHNVTVLLAYLLSGFSMYLLGKYMTGSVGAGLVAGLIFTFSTYHVDQSSHLIILTTQWIPLWILSVIRLFREDHPSRHALLAALFLALTALSSWLLLLFSALWLGFYLVYLLVWEREQLNWPTLRALGLMGIVALILVGPLLFPLLTGFPSSQGGAQGWIQVPYHGENAIDILTFFVPSRRHPLFGPFVEPLHQRIGRRQVFLGYTTLALALLGVIKYRRRARFWALSTLVFFSMSLGAYIRFNGVLSERPLQPWLIPFARFIHDPTRLTVMTTLGLALLAALGVAWLVQKVRCSARAWVVVGLSALALFEYLPWPLPTTPVNVPAFYEQLQQETDLFALADIPVRQLELRRLSMFYQIVHQKPIVEGIVARIPPGAYAFIDQHPILSAFAESDSDPPGNDVSRQLTSLADAGVRYLVLHLRFLTTQQLEAWQLYLPHAPFYRDDQIVVYRTRPVLGDDLQVPLPVNEALGLAHARLDNRYLRTGEPLSLQVAWVATQSPEGSYRVRWALVDPAGHVARIVEGEPCPGWPTETWQEGDFGLGQYELPTDLPPGPYRLQVQLVDEQGHTATRDVHSVLILPSEGATPAAVDVEPVATFDDQIALTRFLLLPGDQMLHLQFDWNALQEIDRDYKLFVHLLDNGGQLVSQLDTMPRDWTAPTSAWRTGEAVSDLVSLDTYGVTAGAYTLSIGLYDAVTGERLPLRLPDGSLAPNSTLQREVYLP
ncbi:MAG: hypothetical protein ISS49_18660 [Anaerolineae bacterium]|nr:hypothetical protein [Anaerolineae bacterium]